MRAEPKDPETVLFEYPNGIPHTLDDELNERTGVPHWSAVVDELADHLLGIATVDNVSTDILIGCVEDYGMALEQAVMEIHNEGLQVLVTNRAKLNEHSVVGTMDVGDLMENYGLTEVDAKAFITEHAEMIEAAMWDATWQYYKRNGLEFIPEEQREVIE